MPASAEPQSPLELLMQWERSTPNALWLIQPLAGGALQTWTWGQAADEIRRIAGFLREHYPQGSRIALLSKNCAPWFIADCAIWAAGHVCVPIYPNLTGESVRQILELSGAAAIFVGKLDDWPTMSGGLPSELPVMRMPDTSALAGIPWQTLLGSTALAGPLHRDADELATIVYTSGTTGIPKGVMHSFKSMAEAARILGHQSSIGSADRLLSYLPTAHVADRLFTELLSLRGGCCVYFPESLETFARDLQRARPTVFLSVPRLWLKFQMAVFAKQPPQKLARLLRIPIVRQLVSHKIKKALGLDAVRMAMSGTAPLAANVVAWYRSLGIELLEGYGMTENFAISHSGRPGSARIGSVGHAQVGVDVRFDETGEILVRSPSMMLGYYEDPERTREALTSDGFLRTGDLGQLDADGQLRITGRAKEQFKTSKGKYVAPAPIENRLANHPKVEAALVTGMGHPQPFALVMLGAGEWDKCASGDDRRALEESLDAERLALNAQLDPHERLDYLVVVREQWNVSNGLVTPTLKLKRAALEDFYGPHFMHWNEQKKAVIWAA